MARREWCSIPACFVLIEDPEPVVLYSDRAKPKVIYLCEKHLAALEGAAKERGLPLLDFRD